MATPIVMPRQGNTVESCVLIEWKKKKGDPVEANEIICEVETDKAVFEIESPVDGILLDIFFDEGDDIPVLTNIAVIGENNEKYDDLKPEMSKVPGPSAEKSEKKLKTDFPVVPESMSKVTSFLTPSSESGISPRAKKLANKFGVHLSDIIGTGPGGRIIERDVVKNAQSNEPLTPAAKVALNKDWIMTKEQGSGIGGRITSSDVLSSSETRKSISSSEDRIREIPLKGIRKLIAERMLESVQNSAQLTLNRTADATAILTLRKNYKHSKQNTQLNQITINDMILFAVSKVILEHPDLNSHFLNDKIIYYENTHLGFAVDTPHGLMVPVIKNVQNLNIITLSEESKRLSSACLERKIQPEELNGGTFTVTNLGNLGIETFTPVLNLPQVAILGVGSINPKPVTIDNGIKFVPHLTLSLTIDHQVIDGASGARFLQDLAKAISEIERFTNI